MKAIIVCGGLAKRMGSLTEDIPKSMVKINDKPILWYQLQILKSQGITDIILCVGHLSEKIIDYFKDGSELGINITYSKEDELLGTGGAVKNIGEGWVKDSFIVIYGDIISNIDYNKLYEFHKKNNSVATIVVREKETIGSSLIEIDENSKIVRFVERPDEEVILKSKENGFKNLVNSGIYVLDPDVFDLISAAKFDFGHDLFPILLENRKDLFGYPIEKYWREVGTIERYGEFEKDVNDGVISFS